MAIDKPDLTRVWAEGAPNGNVVDPDITTPGKFSNGWQAEVPPFEHFNFIQKLQTEGLAYLNEQGLPEWDPNTVYPINAIVKANDGELYRAISEQSGKDPISNPEFWSVFDINKKLTRVNSVSEIENLEGKEGYQVSLAGKRAGIFEFNSSDLSTEVAADALQGFYIAPFGQDGTSGAWVRQPGNELPNPAWFGGLVDGTLSDAALQACVDLFPGQRIALNDGEHNYSAYPTGIDGVRFEGSSRITWTDVELPVFNGIFTGGKEVALVSGVLRYYDSGPSGAGWYMLVDQGGNHDPILAGPVTASGSGAVILSINIPDFGLDPDLWTPAGFVVGPDEKMASQGVSVGASVGTESITIQGSVNTRQNEFVSSDGTSFSGSTSRYRYEWINEGASNARLLMTQDNPASFYRVSANGLAKYPIITSRQRNGSGQPRPLPSLAAVGTDGSGNVQYEISFWSLVDGSRVTNQSSDMQFWVDDPSAISRTLIWDDIDPTLAPGSNIWFVGTFVRKPSSL